MSTQADMPRSDAREAPTEQNPDQNDAMDFQLPANLELIRQLGHGSMATVVLARDTVLKRMVAVKFLRRELSADPVCRRRFERENTGCRQRCLPLDDNHLFGRSPDTDAPYIVMEYVDGKILQISSKRVVQFSI